jgi:Ni/Co efflux regulator RcnB
MQVRNFVVIMAVLVGFAVAPLARAFADEGRDPAAADSSATQKNNQKNKKKKKKAKKGKTKKKTKKTTRHARASKKNSVGTHYPTQPGGSGFADIPAEKKDDLPPPSAPPAN